MWIVSLFRNWVRTGILLGVKDAVDQLEGISPQRDEATLAELHVRFAGRVALPPPAAPPQSKEQASPERAKGRRGKDAA